MARATGLNRRLAHVLAASVLLGLSLPLAACASPGGPAPAEGHSLGAFYAQRLAWSACGEGFRCAWLKVPLDYSRPGGRRLSLAVAELPAPAGPDRIGSLILNPGGPGVSGIAFARGLAPIFSSRIRNRFDIVGFDPRGVGLSSPVHCLSSAQLDRFVDLDPAVDAPGELAQLEAFDRFFVRQCELRSGWLLPHLGTLDAARDLDVLRAALGDRRLTYLGKSYGTYLGAEYARLFPGRVRALVLDGAVDPGVPALAADRVQAVGFEVDLGDFLRWCVAGRCALGATLAAASAALNRLVARVDREPEAVGGRQLGPGELFYALADGLYDPAWGWPALKAALASALAGDGAPMLQLTDEYTERSPTGSYSNLLEAFSAIWCADQASPRAVADYAQAAAAAAQAAPHFGAPNVWSDLLCAYWPGVPRLVPTAMVTAAPIMVVGNSRDPATPYVWAEGLARRFPHAGLLTFAGDGHTAYLRGSPCVDQAVDDYLVNRALPAPGTVCR